MIDYFAIKKHDKLFCYKKYDKLLNSKKTMISYFTIDMND